MPWTAAAIAGAAIVGAVASNSAANKQSDAANAGIAEQRTEGAANRTFQQGIYDQNRTDQLAQIAQQRQDAAPYMQAGYGALEALRNGTAPQGDMYANYQRGAFEADPGYQFRLSEGEKGIQRAAAASGGAYSGATLKALQRFDSGLASQEYGAYDTRQNNKENQFNTNRDFRRNNLATLAGIGQTATTQTGIAGATGTGAIGVAGGQLGGQIGRAYTNQGNNIASLMGDAGQARASGYVGVSNALGSGLKDLYNNYRQNQFLGGSATLPGGTTPNYDNSSAGYGQYSAPGANPPAIDYTSGDYGLGI